MPDPVISHRCPSCGASIRERAFFCPECGNQLEEVPAEVEHSSAAPTLALPIEKNSETQPPPSEQPMSPRQRPGGNPPDYRINPAQPGGRQKLDHVGSRRHTEGELGQRVDRIRRISTNVLDQAAYDPSLRFLLVSAFLFLLFLVILLLSKFIR